ncbi:MAG TPA: flagellar biosynthetic protein FliO [Candidatus Rhabdochlamydia sp.]|jgi:flagellar biogenesis protein FliO|nr:flagellar biosynthetic protein FliO [Candidatus Rhabdochlamydia sp.]
MLYRIKYLFSIFIVSSASLFAQMENTSQDPHVNDLPYSVSKELMPFPDSASFTRMWITIAAALALLFVTLWLLRRFKTGHFKKFGGNSSTFTIIERKTLSPKTMLYIVEINNKRLLISESQVEVRTLTSESIICGLEKN